MREYRRFELHKGNKEKFWEIKRYDKNLYFREGNIKRKTGEKEPTVKREEKKDFRQAQLSYDKEIQRKLSLGYEEVQRASAPSEEVDFQAIRLVSLDGQHTLDLGEGEATQILNFMIDKLVLNRRAKVLDISKWKRRTLNLSKYKSFEEIDTMSKDYQDFFDKWLALSKSDRTYDEEEQIPLFKFTDPQYWIITPSECQKIIQSIQSEVEKRRDKLDEIDKKASGYFQLKEIWLDFHLKAKASGGYQVLPCSMQFHSVKHGHRFFMDTRGWSGIFNLLSDLDIWDHAEPEYVTNGFDSIEDHLDNKLFGDNDINSTPLDFGRRSNLIDQLQYIQDEINDAYNRMTGNTEKSEQAVLMDAGFRWNSTNLQKLKKVLVRSDEPWIEDAVFEKELADFYNEEIHNIALEQCPDGDIDAETKKIINEILNDACHLLNHTHQEIHQNEDELLPSAEDEHADVFSVQLLATIHATLSSLYPKIEDYDFGPEDDVARIYPHRPSGLDEELLEDWYHLLPDALDCLSLLASHLEFLQIQNAQKEQFQNARDFCMEAINHELSVMKLQSELASARRLALSVESDDLGKVMMFKFTDHSEPWVITPTEIALLVEAVYQAEIKDSYVLDLMKFMNTAAECGGCTLLNASNN